MSDPNAALAGKFVLIVEDDYFIAKRLARACEAAGATVLGPCSDVAKALALSREAERIDLAVLDINLHGDMVFPVADVLSARGVPFAFATGYDRDVVVERHAAVSIYQKPVDPAELIASLLKSRPRT